MHDCVIAFVVEYAITFTQHVPELAALTADRAACFHGRPSHVLLTGDPGAMQPTHGPSQ